MKGSINSMGDGVWRLRFEVGLRADGKRDQRMMTFRGNKKQAEQKLRDLLGTVDGNTFVEPQKLTLGQWLTEWQTNVLAGRVRASTFKRYAGIIRNHILKADIARVPLQKLRPSHIERYYATCGVLPVTLPQHHVIFHSALKKAVREKLLTANPATDVDKAPRRKRGKSNEGHLPCWSAEDARKFLDAAKRQDPQTAALFATALDTGARKSELLGLRWADVNLDEATIRIHQQLTKQPGHTAEGTRRDPELGADEVRS